jgi:hypothetical protein
LNGLWSASGGLVRQRVSLHAWVAIRPPAEFGVLCISPQKGSIQITPVVPIRISANSRRISSTLTPLGCLPNLGLLRRKRKERPPWGSTGRKSFLPDLDRNLKWRSSEGASARWSDGSPHQILAFWTSQSARTTTAFEIDFFSCFANLQNSVPNCINKLPPLSRLSGATSTRHSTTLGWTSSRTQTQIFVDCADYRL